MKMKRNQAAEIARDTLDSLQRGFYFAGSKKVSLQPSLREAVERTITYSPNSSIPSDPTTSFSTEIEVTKETTLEAAARVVAEGHLTAALNFASAKNPGGGFQKGAVAQEETLARSSGLYSCIFQNEMYSYHRARKNPLYSHYIIYSPNVPVFKNDLGESLQKPYLCSFITSPAVNAGAMRRRKDNHEEILATMAERIDRVMSVAAYHNNEVIILGAWGCGVFRNDPHDIASLFQQSLENYQGVFRKVVFAILDNSKNERFFRPFQEAFL